MSETSQFIHMTVLFQKTVISKSAITELASTETRRCFHVTDAQTLLNSTQQHAASCRNGLGQHTAIIYNDT
jgi:hypothetical protein